MKVTVAVLAMFAVFSAAPVMASVTDSAGSNSGFEAHHHHHHHSKGRHHHLADSRAADESPGASATE